MRTILFLVAGLFLMASFLIVAKMFSEHFPSAPNWAVALGLSLWLMITATNMWIGGSKAGYSVADELPILLLLFAVPAAAAVKKLESLTTAPDKLHAAGKEIYFYFPNGVSGSSLWKHPLDRVMSVPATMRNWNTVNALYQMALECG